MRTQIAAANAKTAAAGLAEVTPFISGIIPRGTDDNERPNLPATTRYAAILGWNAFQGDSDDRQLAEDYLTSTLAAQSAATGRIHPWGQDNDHVSLFGGGYYPYASYQAELAANMLEARDLLDRAANAGPQLRSAGLTSPTELIVSFDREVDISAASFAINHDVNVLAADHERLASSEIGGQWHFFAHVRTDC